MGLLEGVATAAAPVRRMNTSVLAVSRLGFAFGLIPPKEESIDTCSKASGREANQRRSASSNAKTAI
jgi:hypothetical protein